MTIGWTFPVRDCKETNFVPWGLLEQHRSRAIKNHYMPLERLAALGGLTVAEIARIVTDQAADAKMSDADARKVLGIKETDDAKKV